MRAKVAGVVLVTCGLFGVVSMAAAPASSELAHRDKKHDMDKHDDGHGKHGWCIAERESVVGPVCIDVHDVDVLSDILNT